MYGNMKGWIISGVLVLLVGAVLFKTAQLPPITPPTGKIKFTEKLEMPADPKTLLTGMDKDCDSSELYRQAIHEYDMNESLYSRDGKLVKQPMLLADSNPKGVQLILEAADCGKFELFANKPEQVVHYNSRWPDLDALEMLGKHTINTGAIARTKKDYAKAEQYINAGFVLGYRLYTERVVWEELNIGMNLMIDASYQMSRAAKDKGDAARQQTYLDFFNALSTYKTEKIVKPIVMVLTSIDKRVIGPRGGDIFGLVRESPERVWKVEALLALGRMKYNTSNLGDQIWAKREVKKYVNDPDPAVARAAKLADELTIEGYRMLGG